MKATTVRSPATRCPAGGAHRYDLTTARDDAGNIGDRGVCRGCGLVAFWRWPTPREMGWSSLRRGGAA